jgi:hypothetical protein
MWILYVIGVLLIVSWAWYKFGSGMSIGASTAGKTVTKTLDTAAAMTAYASLTSIRALDSVESNPAAVAACDLLRDVVTAWKRPDPVPPTPQPVVDPVVKQLAERLEKLETKGV